MIKEIQNFIHKTATSRKFWAAVAAAIPLALDHNWRDFALVWIAYAGTYDLRQLKHCRPVSPSMSPLPGKR